MLFRYEEAGKCRLLGVVVDRPGEANAAFADAMNAWAGRPDLPVGLVRNGADGAQVFIDYAGVADARDGDGRLLFPRAAPRPEGRPDGWPLYRKLLAGAPDSGATGNVANVKLLPVSNIQFPMRRTRTLDTGYWIHICRKPFLAEFHQFP